jgi:hypothetical protein
VRGNGQGDIAWVSTSYRKNSLRDASAGSHYNTTQRNGDRRLSGSLSWFINGVAYAARGGSACV